MRDKNEIYKSYELYSAIFSYPKESLRGKVNDIQKHLQLFYPEAAEIFFPFASFANKVDLKLWEEIYTRSFDVQAITTLDLGYVLFGDDYKRGELLVNFNREHKNAGNNCGDELADHLPNVLRLLGKLDDEELLQDIISLILSPALKKIESEFDSKHIAVKNKVYRKHHRTIIEPDKSHGLIYRRAIQALRLMLKHDFPKLLSGPHSDKNFSGQVAKELQIEKLG